MPKVSTLHKSKCKWNIYIDKKHPSFRNILFSIWQMPKKPLWLKKLLGWSRVALFAVDTGSDVYVGVDLIQRCHYRYASGVFSFFWMPGLLSGGAVSAKYGGDYLKKSDSQCAQR